MLKNRNISLLISLTVLMIAILSVYFFQQDKDRVAVDPTLFKVDDLTKIDGIILQSKDGTVKLHYESTGWKVDDHFDADRQLITVLFATLEQAIPKRPVAEAQRDSINAMINATKISVGLYDGTILRKQFEVAGDPRRKETYYRSDENSEPYLMSIPGYRVFVSQIFELNENGWRDKRVFDFRWQDFKTLSAVFPLEGSSDFTIGKKSTFFTVLELMEADTSKVMTYLDDLSLLRADQIISPGFSSHFDSLSATTPLKKIEVTDVAKRSYKLSLFAPLKGEPLVLGKVNEKDLMLFDREKVFRIYRKKGYFKSKPR